MIDMGFAIIGGILYFTGQYGLALVLIILSIISGVGALLMAFIYPDWYQKKRSQAGLEVDLFNPKKGIGALIATKIVTLAALVWVAKYIAGKGGYF